MELGFYFSTASFLNRVRCVRKFALVLNLVVGVYFYKCVLETDMLTEPTYSHATERGHLRVEGGE